jgi:hypothetical protein
MAGTTTDIRIYSKWTVKYANDLVSMAKEETVLQGMTDRLIEIGRKWMWKKQK